MPDPEPSVPDELVEIASRVLWDSGEVARGSRHPLARAVLSAVTEAGWRRLDSGENVWLEVVAAERDQARQDARNEFAAWARVTEERDEARAQAEALAETLVVVQQRATYGYQDLNSGGVLSTVRKLADEALRAFRESQEPDHAA